MKPSSKHLFLICLFTLTNTVVSQNLDYTDYSYISEPYLDSAPYIETAIGDPFRPGVTDVNLSHELISKRFGSLSRNNLNVTTDYKTRLATIKNQIIQMIPPTLRSIERDIQEANINRCILGVGNFLGAWFGVMLGINGNFAFYTLPVGQKLQAIAQVLYGYGYVTQFVLDYENPRLKCSTKDFLTALEEYEFLDNPDPDTPVAVDTYYTTKLNHEIKRKMSCITNRQGSNDDARIVNGLIDIYTELQQESFA